MDLLLEIIFRIAEFISSTGETGEEEIYNFLVSEGYDIEDINNALSIIKAMEAALLQDDEEDGWSIFYDTKLYSVLKEKGIPKEKWDLFLTALVTFYEETGIDRTELERFAEEFSKFVKEGSWLVLNPTYKSN